MSLSHIITIIVMEIHLQFIFILLVIVILLLRIINDSAMHMLVVFSWTSGKRGHAGSVLMDLCEKFFGMGI